MRRFLTLFVTILGALAFGIGTAHAAGDNTLESSTPSPGEVVTLAPTQLQLKFTLPLGGAEAVAQMGLVLTCENKITNLSAPQLAADGVTVSAALTQIPGNGVCTVKWKLVDGSAGSFQFTSNAIPTTTVPVNNTGTGVQTTIPSITGNAEVTTPPRLGGPVGLLRWIAFFCVAAFFGGLVFVKTVWPEGVEYGITEKYFRQLLILSVASLVLLMGLMTARETGGSILASLSPTEWGPMWSLDEGRAVGVRLIAVAGLGWFAWITLRILEQTNVAFTTGLMALTMATYGFDRFTGRAVVLGAVIAILHMTFISIWVGSIAIIWRVILHGPGDIDLVHALRGWSRIATPLTIGIVVTGAIQTWRVDGLSLINSGHGRVVLLKVILFVLLLIVSASIRQFVVVGMKRAKSLNERVVYRLKRPAGIELALSITVLAASSWLMAMRPPYVLNRDKGPRVEYAIVQEMEGEDNFRVRLSVTPGNVGPNRVLVELFGPSRIQNFTVELTPANPNFSGYTINVPITRPGAALVDEKAGLKLLSPGQWTVRVNGVTTTGKLKTMTSAFIIADGVTVTTQPKQGLKPVETTVSTSSTIAPSGTVAPPATTTTTIAPGAASTLPTGASSTTIP